MKEIKFRNLYAEEIDIRVGQAIKTDKFEGVTLLLYKNARVDMDLLDEVVGANNWQRLHTRDNANCIISIWDDDKKQWVSKEDTGTESNTEAAKGLASDSFKRSGTNWGIGRSLYTSPKIMVACKLDNSGKKPASGIGWYVKDIDYNDKNVISRLVVMETKYDKDTQVVFDWSLDKGQSHITNTNSCTSHDSSNINNLSENEEKTVKSSEMSLKQALQYFLKSGKYANVTFDKVPTDYLKWVSEKMEGISQKAAKMVVAIRTSDEE